jgi:phospholipid-translocating ATPase
LQAANSSDYSIAQFRFLSRLLLVHGRWSYARISLAVLNFYLKNLVFSLLSFWLQFYCNFSSFVLIEFGIGLFYNTIFTSFAIVFAGIQDRDISEEDLLEFPQLYYSEGIKRRLYTHKRFCFYMVESFYQSVICFLIPYFALEDSSSSDISGRVVESTFTGFIMAVSAIFCVNLSAGIDSTTWTFPLFLGVFSGCLAILIYPSFQNDNPASGFYGIYGYMMSSPHLWCCLILTIVLAFAPRFVIRMWTRICDPMDSDIIREISLAKSSTHGEYQRLPQEDDHVHVVSPLLERKAVLFDLTNGSNLSPTGFSFEQTKGMAGVIMGKHTKGSSRRKKIQNLVNYIRPSGSKNKTQ